VSDSWHVIGPVLVIGALAPGAASLSHVDVYALAFGAQALGAFLWMFARDRMLEPLPFRELVTHYIGALRVVAVLSPLALVISIVASAEPAVLLAIGPLVWLFQVFSHDRRERYSATLELNRAYRGPVMLLADVVEFEDGYTARHCRSVLDLVQAVAEEINISPDSRQELEFAALLHDVGKISIPKEILNKPAKLTPDEFELMKTHTIEGQFMLDRVGGVLARIGEIVRSCHERWDGRGYPDGLAAGEIPLPARIVFACDAYNAMTTNRPYRAALSQDEALSELLTNAGTQFDPDIVDAIVRVVERPEETPSADHVRALLAKVQFPEQIRAAG
jgi:HD-GYP domain-containing protein (c-di-GMP phosphodiesterase class II)